MRNWIDLFEKVVYRDRAPDPTVIAINPSPVEWKASFPRGAGGVLCQNGDLVVGMGPMLPHDAILDKAGLDQSQEKYRLQLGPNRGFAEMWLDDTVRDAYDEATDDATRLQILESGMQERYGASIEEATRDIDVRTSRLAPGYRCRVVLYDESAECFTQEDDDWRDSCF